MRLLSASSFFREEARGSRDTTLTLRHVRASASPSVGAKLFLGGGKQIGLVIKETLQKAVSLSAGSKEAPAGKQAALLRYCRRYKRLELRHNKGGGEEEEGRRRGGL